MKDLHDETQQFIKGFEADHLVKLSGTESVSTDYEEVRTGIDFTWGGFRSYDIRVETVEFHPEHFSFNYKGVRISGPMSGVAVETRRLENDEEVDTTQYPHKVEAAILEEIEQRCGFTIDPMEFDEPEIGF